jgi:hypothetical protein
MSRNKRSLPIRAAFLPIGGYPVVAGFVLLGTVLGVPRTALAHAQLHPRLFAVPAATFPSGSHVVRAGVESNRQLLRDQAGHFGLPPAALGRRTGYYMDAVEGDPATEPRPYTAYLVSIFRSPRQAQLAFGLRWDTWFAATYYTTPSPAPIALGDKGEEALFHTLDPSQPRLAELLFRRGAILVEVFQGTGGAAPTVNQLHSFFAIATKLDELAGKHPLGGDDKLTRLSLSRNALVATLADEQKLRRWSGFLPGEVQGKVVRHGNERRLSQGGTGWDPHDERQVLLGAPAAGHLVLGDNAGGYRICSGRRHGSASWNQCPLRGSVLWLSLIDTVSRPLPLLHAS